MTDVSNPPTPARTIDRRTVLKAGAWSAPAIIAATAVPMAAASTTQFDLRFAAPQFGEGDPWALTPDLTGRYQAAIPAAIVIQNAGTEPLTPSTPLSFSLRFDNRLWSVSTVRAYFIDGDSMTLTGSPTVSGRTTTLSFTTNVTIPVGTEIGDGLFLAPESTYLPNPTWTDPAPSFDWPEYDPAASPQWLLISPDTDARTYENSRVYPTNAILGLEAVPGQGPAQLTSPGGVAYRPAMPNGVRIVSSDATYPSGLGFGVQLQYDNRVWDVSAIRIDGVGQTFTTAVYGQLTILTVRSSEAVPASGVLVETTSSFLPSAGTVIDPVGMPVYWVLVDPDTGTLYVPNDPPNVE